MRNWKILTAVLASVALAACGGRDDNTDNNPPPPASTYSVGGTVSGLSGTGLKLKNNGGDELTVTGSTFTFATKIATGGAYAVTVSAQPNGQTCTVANGTGTVGTANVTNVAVTCANNPVNTFSVSGNASGVSGPGLKLKLNNGADLDVTANGGFTFPTPIASGQPYSVTISGQPQGQTCTVANGSGTIANANVTNVTVTCATAQPVVTPNAMVLRVGDGTGAPASGTSVAVSLQEFAPTAASAAVKTVAVDSAQVSLTYTSTTEGGLTRSDNGKLVAFGAYRKPAGTASVTATATAATRSAVGVDAAGNATYVDFPGAFANSNIRSATTVDGTGYWAAGTSNVSGTFSGGVWFNTNPTGTPVQITSTPNNSRWVSIYGGQLYVSSAQTSGTTPFVGVVSVGTGIPQTSGAFAKVVANSANASSPNGYAFVDSDGNGSVDVLYLASDNQPANKDALNVTKFTLNTADNTWVAVADFVPALPAADSTITKGTGARGLAAARAADGTVIVYVTTGSFVQTGDPANANDNKLVFFNDNGTNKTPAVSVIAAADTGYNFRGVALAPNP
ncbi:hypothetical protein FGE12_04760 [Aggregicoccus sp. 17bor-14]|uniref:hypothetical protein n=1 Tax=Myxococcaceae TaxID=31 RepID=UPI00129CD666|nr:MULTISPECIES: hypothetical protein [Myxococcaceae]MBF5041691.1 hypothetical protein [Simulacricoccus sp. 17bor-14]MRI87473.1 hypothetical protein [Aggregicoccus sp. 17bor-14]